MNKTTSPFSSFDGLTQDERDDLSSIVRDLNHLHADMDKKQTRGREIVAEQLKLKEREEELMDLVVNWVQRPRPPQLRRSGPLRITPAARLLIRDLHKAVTKAISSGESYEHAQTVREKAKALDKSINPKDDCSGEDIWEPGKVQPDINEDVLLRDFNTLGAAPELADINPKREEEEITSSHYLLDLAVGEEYNSMKVTAHTKIPLDHQMEDVDS